MFVVVWLPVLETCVITKRLASTTSTDRCDRPIDATDATIPIDPTDTTDPIDPTDSTDPIDLTNLTTQIDPTDPTRPIHVKLSELSVFVS